MTRTLLVLIGVVSATLWFRAPGAAFGQENPPPPHPAEVPAETAEPGNDLPPVGNPVADEETRESQERTREDRVAFEAGEEDRECEMKEKQREVAQAEEIREGGLTAEEQKENNSTAAEIEHGREHECREYQWERENSREEAGSLPENQEEQAELIALLEMIRQILENME